jgi:hypothetical protein
MEANKNFAKWLSCGIQISGTFGLHHVFIAVENKKFCCSEDSQAVPARPSVKGLGSGLCDYVATGK